ncbi:Zn(2)-C6 fungal-type DNA-binding domain protein [Akanthomyces lecanii RCEF 1005]|uniref:Zn(2)-C6 fungal-type DNA-binding domain protein n=1 Tax=Akanthomyces lecanii RCEF 1005 TaxID=1081108 RepID=A0A168GNK7_CORDF|nr:Zn(2)-C6 fungal-type DNA-binding domain protein [Akanthomyces lecanii RCEF 1005]
MLTGSSQCDYGRPECSQCKRSNLPCSGYERDLIFVSHNEANSPPPATTKSRTTSPSGIKKPAASSSPSSTSNSSSRNSSSPDPPAFTTIEFYHTAPPVRSPPPPPASPCKLLSDLNLFDLPQIRTQFMPLDTAINAVVAATSSYTQLNPCYPTQSQTLYSQALFELRQSKERGTQRHDSWHNTAFTSLMLQLVEVVDGANVPIADWFSHSAEIANMPPMNSIQQFGASDILTLTFCRTAMLARDLFGGYELSDPNAWYLQSWGEPVNDDLHRVLDVLALLPSHIQQSDRIALNPYEDAIKLDFEQQHKRLSALVQGLYTSRLACGDFAPWVMHPYESFNACTSSDDTPCMSVAACQKLAFIFLAQLMLFSTNEKVRCSMPLTPESMNQSIQGDIEWLVMLETMNSMQHVIAHCIAVDNSLVGMQTIVMPLRMLNQFAASYSLAETQDWCRHTIQGLVDRNCQVASWSILTAQSMSTL